jgi:hypothetical protein
MKRLSVVLFALLLVGSARSAEAALFTLQSYTVSVHNSESGGLGLWTEKLLPAPKSFWLSHFGETYSASLFRVGTKEKDVDKDDEKTRPVTVGFSFSSPLGFSGTAEGISGAVKWFGGVGYVAWDNPLILKFGTTGLLQVTLMPAVFGVPGYSTVGAKFTLLRNDSPGPVGVPEPSTLLLMGAGIAGLAGLRRRRTGAIAA